MFRLYANVRDIEGNPVAGTKMTVVPSGGPTVVNNIIITENHMTAFSDASGYVYIDLVGSGVPLRVKISNTGYDKYLISPESGIVDLTTL